MRTTRQGKFFILMTISVGFVAVVTGNNMLFLVLGSLLALILVSFFLSEMSLRKLQVCRRLPKHAQAGKSHVVEIEVLNEKTSVSSYAIEVEDLRSGQPTDKRCFFLKISAGSSQVAAYRRKPFRRGIDRHTGFRVATRFPFGLFEKSRYYSMDNELIVYPQLIDDFPAAPGSSDCRYGEGVGIPSPVGDELDGVKPFREGDDPGAIYWPKSTRPNGRVVKQLSQNFMRTTDVVLDDVRPRRAKRQTWNLEFEKQIRVAASTCVAHLRAGNAVRLVTTSAKVCKAVPASGADPILRFLALLRAVDEAFADRRHGLSGPTEEAANDVNSDCDDPLRRDCCVPNAVVTAGSDCSGNPLLNRKAPL